MNFEQHQTLRFEIERELEKAELPLILNAVIGRLYKFVAIHGSHHHALSGTIQAIEVSDEGGLDLYVSNPRFWGERLISIKYCNGKWMAYIDIKPREWSDEALEKCPMKTISA